MPHLIVEYSREIEKSQDMPSLFKAIHDAAFATALFSKADIKLRAYPSDYSLVAGKSEKSVAITVKLLAGRDTSTKKAMTAAIHDAVANLKMDISALTVEACDIDRGSYSKS